MIPLAIENKITSSVEPSEPVNVSARNLPGIDKTLEICSTIGETNASSANI